jgi:hypothetical protein
MMNAVRKTALQAELVAAGRSGGHADRTQTWGMYEEIENNGSCAAFHRFVFR